MYMPNNLLQLNEEGKNNYKEKFRPDDEFLVSMDFEASDKYPAFFVVSNLRIFRERTEPPKPLKLTSANISQSFKPCLDEEKCIRTYFPERLRELTDEQLREKHPKWIEKQERDLTPIKTFLTPEYIWLYLSGELGADLKVQAEKYGRYHQALRLALNRYLSLGSKIGLLPIKFDNVGKAERVFTVKPGPKKTPRGEDVISASPVITLDDKRVIKHLLLANGVDRIQGKFKYEKVFTLYQKQYCSSPGYVTKNGKKVPTLIVDERKSLNISQFTRHANKLLTDIQKHTLKVGKHAFDNNRRDKTGSAREGIFAAAHYCEIDSTPLPVYLAYPLDRKNRLSAGKVHLCLVGCVSTHLIVGFSISFSSPSWETVMEALLNCMQDKVKFAQEYGMDITKSEWPSQHIPVGIRVDCGSENPASIIQKVIESNVGIKESDWCPPGKPALKGTIEKILGIIQDLLDGLAGTVDKSRDGSHQHASQRAILQKDEIIRLVILAITIFNSTSDRPKLITREMEADEVQQTPSAMWQYVSDHEIYGRPKISQQDLPKYFWKLLRKRDVKVTNNNVMWEQMGYYSEWADKEHWFSRAANRGNYSVQMVSFGGLVDHLYFQDESGELQTFTLTRDYEKYRGMSLEQVYNVQRKRAVESKRLELERNQAKVNLQDMVTELTINGEKFYQDAPLNHQKTIQKGIKERNEIMIAQEQRELALKYADILNLPPQTTNYNFSDQSTSERDDYDPEEMS